LQAGRKPYRRAEGRDPPRQYRKRKAQRSVEEEEDVAYMGKTSHKYYSQFLASSLHPVCVLE
jgi:hypothetical protein